MGRTTDILTASLSHLETLSYSPAPEIAWPNVSFDPPSEGPWLEAMLFPNEPTNLTWDDTAVSRYLGLIQVLVCYRPDEGQQVASELADFVIAHFAKGTVLASARVQRTPWQAPAVMERKDRIFIPVRIPYVAICKEEQ